MGGDVRVECFVDDLLTVVGGVTCVLVFELRSFGARCRSFRGLGLLLGPWSIVPRLGLVIRRGVGELGDESGDPPAERVGDDRGLVGPRFFSGRRFANLNFVAGGWLGVLEADERCADDWREMGEECFGKLGGRGGCGWLVVDERGVVGSLIILSFIVDG